METINIIIPAQPKNYPIIIGNSIIDKVSTLIDLHKYSKIVIITDETLEGLWLEPVGNGFTLPAGRQEPFHSIVIPSGEQAKTVDTLQLIWKKLHLLGCDRKSLVINLGGGVVGDIGGFAASTYMRGIDFIQMPTTILSAVDASVGGKTAIDFDGVKNLIGAFQQPTAVIIDVGILKTLPQREVFNGFAEVIKHGLIQDKAYFDLVTSKKPAEFSSDELVEIITGSCRIKSNIVMSDETEYGPRKLLNFGHTIGHAIEALSWQTDTPLLHGEAIHIGMIAETNISNMIGLLSNEETNIIEQKLKNTGLPISIKGLDSNEIMKKITSDKKSEKGQVKWTLLKHIGEAVYDQIVDNAIVTKALEKVIF